MPRRAPGARCCAAPGSMQVACCARFAAVPAARCAELKFNVVHAHAPRHCEQAQAGQRRRPSAALVEPHRLERGERRS